MNVCLVSQSVFNQVLNAFVVTISEMLVLFKENVEK